MSLHFSFFTMRSNKTQVEMSICFWFDSNKILTWVYCPVTTRIILLMYVVTVFNGWTFLMHIMHSCIVLVKCVCFRTNFAQKLSKAQGLLCF